MRPPKTLLVPTDFSDSASKALSVAIEFAKKFDARIVIIHACKIDMPLVFATEGSFSFPPNFLEQVLTEATSHVERMAKEVAEKEGLHVQGIAILDRAETAILEQADSLPADMIVMGTNGLTGLKHLALGSVAERVVQLARCPVMTVNASH